MRGIYDIPTTHGAHDANGIHTRDRGLADNLAKARKVRMAIIEARKTAPAKAVKDKTPAKVKTPAKAKIGK